MVLGRISLLEKRITDADKVCLKNLDAVLARGVPALFALVAATYATFAALLSRFVFRVFVPWLFASQIVLVVLTIVASRYKARAFHFLVLLPLVCACAVEQPDESESEMTTDILHSDLPIFGHGSDNEWPQHFYDEDSFGCISRVGFGDWVFQETGAEVPRGVQWYRFSNYGAFHCWANTYRAYERARLDGADSNPSFFVFLSKTSVDQRDIELWTIQIGARPGSEYLLLSRAPADGVIEKFTVLQSECPRTNVRDAGSLDILITRYCAVNSRTELVRLARSMAKRSPLGTLSRVPDNDEDGAN